MNPHSEVPALCIYPCSENHSEAWCNCGIRAYTLYNTFSVIQRAAYRDQLIPEWRGTRV